MKPVPRGEILVSAEQAKALDREASSSWGLDPFALVEAAGRACAGVFAGTYPGLFLNPGLRIAVAAGSGNNGADAMVMLRALILNGHAAAENCSLVISRVPGETEHTPGSEAFRALRAMGAAWLPWDTRREDSGKALESADLIIDGIAGTGLRDRLRGDPLEMAGLINSLENSFVVSVDVPSGCGDTREADWPVIYASATLAVEPVKSCLYHPVSRTAAGHILPVTGIFPKELQESHGSTYLWDWDAAQKIIPPVNPDDYKYTRGTVEIRAGSQGSAGAARIAARGAQAAGAGLVRLLADRDLYPILASGSGGVMVDDGDTALSGDGRFTPDAMLLGPGWGTDDSRLPVLRRALDAESRGTALVLDADAITLSRDFEFHGSVILTPHAGELARYAGISKEEALASPGTILARLSREKKAVIIFKSHVTWISSPDGRLAAVDGMTPALAAGGSGDLLAGLCAGIAGRTAKRQPRGDLFSAAVAAAALLTAAGKAAAADSGFCDPLTIAEAAAKLAGAAWMGGVRGQRHG
ncbi:NAD(P)H-hydrate epimerase [Breznakiella homolactica]|uniref:ADP-dependent (S)-NAD(P)H-hydrate dehydratase n=1 Tax=Breznakiella homolactica TaxID=2798577 RepID=A0A7T8B9K8_9SPIR|nr:bifunctional ADP-dependent NAD(P)H-hydrate dehydratase/NAD(P)H-hydrate epimerase [Breznakiella homolactica]QQO08060.1 bifunctional ADP-dependent NAD(P)H-hydrate dehydratase/NAD(P)H-hydrate epimerase [Breznakiella homolactica]